MSDAPLPFDEVYAQRQWVRALALHLVRDPGGADDVEQQTWLAAMEHPPRPGNVRGWLGAVVRSKAWKLRRSGERRARHEEAAGTAPAPRRPDEVVAAAEAQRRAVDAVMELDEPYRSTVLLRFFEDLPPSEIASRTGVPLGTVKTRLRRALELLRGRLDRENGGDRRAWAVALLGPGLGKGTPGATAAAATATGVIAMATTTKVLLASAAVALLAAAAYWSSGAASDATKRSANLSTAGTGAGASTVANAAAGRRLHAGADDATTTAAAVAPAAPESAAPPDRARDLFGEVVTTDGTPIAGAVLRVDDVPASSASIRLDVAPVWTSADGRFVVHLRPGDAAAFLVEAAGFARQRIPYLQAGEHAHIVLPRAVRLRVAVTGSDGAPSVGAALHLRPTVDAWTSFVRPHGPPQDAVTGADGRATFDGLAPGAEVRVNAWPKARDVPGTVVLTLPAAGESETTIALAAAAAIRGRVTDARDGHGIAAHVTLSTGIGTDRSVDAAADGTFAIDGNRPGEGVWLRFDAPGYASASVGYAPSKDARPADAALRPGGTATLRCVDETGAPIAGVRVFVSASGPLLSRFDALRSDTDGRLRLEGLDPQQRSAVVLFVDGRASAVVYADFPADVLTADLGDVKLVVGTEVSGRVERPDGQPVARGVVLLRRGMGLDSQQRCTDDLGRFRFAHVAPGEKQIGAAAGGLPNRFQAVQVASDPVEVTLVAEVPRELRIEAVDARGTALAGCEFSVQDAGNVHSKVVTDGDGVAHVAVTGRAFVQFVPGSTDRAADRPSRIARPTQPSVRFTVRTAGHATGVVLGLDGTPLAKALFDVRTDDAFTARLTTDAEGRFDVLVPEGTTSTIELLGVQGAINTPLDDARFAGRIAVTPGATELVLRATAVARDGTLNVRVLTPDGAPAAGAKVVAYAVSSRAEAVVDEKGRATLSGLLVRDLDVFAPPFGGWQPSVRVSALPQGQELTLRLRGTAVIAGRVVDAAKKPVERTSVVLEGASPDQRFNATTDANGDFRLEFPSDTAGPLVVNVQCMIRGGMFDVFVEDVAPGTTGLEVVLK